MSEESAVTSNTTGRLSTSAAAAASTTTTEVQQPQSTQQQQQVPRRIIRRRPLQQSKQQQQQSTNGIKIDPIYLNDVLKSSGLPIDVYSFEIERTVQRCIALNVTHVALQMPEGLLIYSTVLVNVIQQLIHHTIQRQIQISILSDVTYGACCIDDITAAQIGCQLLIHYGHSCLIPIQHTCIPIQYIFVEIQFYIQHLIDCLYITLFPPTTSSSTNSSTSTVETKIKQLSINENGRVDQTILQQQQQQEYQQQDQHIHLYLLGTIQFRHALIEVKEQLLQKYNIDPETNARTTTLTISIPQCKPLSPGEVLGCTSPILNTHLLVQQQQQQSNVSNNVPCRAYVCFVADGRFHLESTMIANHNTIDIFYRYDPYSRLLSIEKYAFDTMKQLRYSAIQYAAKYASTFGIILGTLGRQGNPGIVNKIQQTIHNANRKSFIVLLSEITPQKLQLLSSSYTSSSNNISHDIDSNDSTTEIGTICWVQVACPRLSVDWGHGFSSEDTENDHGETTNNEMKKDNDINETISSKSSPIILLNPYELFVCLEQTEWQSDTYPMDYYSNNGGPWTNYYETNKNRQF